MSIPKISFDLQDIFGQGGIKTADVPTLAEQRQLDRMQELALSLFQAFGEVFHLFTQAVYEDASFAASFKFHHDGSMVLGMTACAWGAGGEIDLESLSPPLDKDMEQFFKFVWATCAFHDDITVDASSVLPERRIIAASPYAVIDLIERLIEPFHRETIDVIGIQQTSKPNLGDNFIRAFAEFKTVAECSIQQGLDEGCSETGALQRLISHMPMRSYASIHAACAHGGWVVNDKRLFAISLEKLRVWADSILSPSKQIPPEKATFRIH